ncbi:SPERT protein, partial [Glareola pratincola]|nr:SPERT protein [Glareola pratincola]
AMSAFDLTNQCTEPEVEYITPRMKLRDDMLVFVDGKWVNEICYQPPIASHRKLFSKKAQNEWSIWEENRALWEENQVLRMENRMLWEENKSLQCLQSQNRAVQVIYTDALQQSLQEENKPFPFFQPVQEKNRVLQDLQQENKRVPIIWKDEKAVTVHEESKDASSDIQQDTDTITAVEEGSPGPAPQQKHKAKEKNTTPTQDKIKSAPSMQGEYEIIWTLQDLYQLLYRFLKENHLLGEEQGCHVLYNVSRSFEEDYNELKLQLNAVKNTVSDIRAQMEMLEKELFAITSTMYEEAGQKLATDHQLGEI